MLITYIHHSCFCVELTDTILLFDYYQGDLPKFDLAKQLYVFASHKHHDHFDLCIFDLAKKYPNITFVLSKDIRMNENYMIRKNIPLETNHNIKYVSKNETLTLLQDGFSELRIETLTSTDEGVAFIVSVSGKTIYHAGDLNFWTWAGESEEEYRIMESNFITEMSKIEGRTFDVAFIPLDPRQEDRFYWGFDYFMRYTNTLQAFPMHFWKDYSVIPRIKSMECSKEYKYRIQTITKEGQIFII